MEGNKCSLMNSLKGFFSIGSSFLAFILDGIEFLSPTFCLLESCEFVLIRVDVSFGLPISIISFFKGSSSFPILSFIESTFYSITTI